MKVALLCASPALLLFHNLQGQTLRFFEFDLHLPYPDSLNMIAATSDPGVLAEMDNQLALPEANRNKHLHGPIGHGTGENNPIYSWHFIPGQWELSEVSAEVCDGKPY